MLCAALAGETQEEKDNQLLNVSSFFLDVSSTRRESAVHNRTSSMRVLPWAGETQEEKITNY